MTNEGVRATDTDTKHEHESQYQNPWNSNCRRDSVIQNPPSNLGIESEISRLWSIPDHQQGIRCKAPRRDDWGVWSNTPQGGVIEGNAADDVLMVDQGHQFPLQNTS